MDPHRLSVFIGALVLLVAASTQGASLKPEIQHYSAEGFVGQNSDELYSILSVANYDHSEKGLWDRLQSLVIPAYFKEFLQRFSPTQIRNWLEDLDVSHDCAGHTLEWFSRLSSAANATAMKESLWALHMVDSWGKIPEGILQGHVNSMGDFDECVQLRASNVQFSGLLDGQNYSDSFSGRYCTLTINPALLKQDAGTDDTTMLDNVQGRTAVSPEELQDIIANRGNEGIPIYPSLGVCLPSSCSAKDIIAIMNATAQLISPALQPVSLGCFTDEKQDYDAGFWAMIAILAVLIGLNLVGTLLDLFRNASASNDGAPKPGKAVQALLAFSLITNIRKWQNTSSGGAENFGCLHGLRFFSMMWVILAHTWLMLNYVPFWNMVDVKKGHKNVAIMVILNGTLSVDTFFIMGGFLVAYNLLKMYDKTGGKLNLLMYYIHRYIRLTPTYAILVGLMATILPNVGSGPYWSILNTWGQWCRDHWWTNLLYINNLVHSNELCQAEAWYLSVDMQFYILTPFIIWPIWKWRNKGLIMFAIITVLSVIAPGLQVYLGDYVPTVLVTRFTGTFYKDIYIKPWARAQTYVVGMWLGYLMFKLRGKKVKLTKATVAAGWILSTAVSLATLFGIYPWFDQYTEVPEASSFLYASLHRFGWGIVISWIIFACVYGYGGYVNRFLSWAPFIPLGRLTFCTYLVSLHLQMIYHLMYRQPVRYSGYAMTAFFFNHVAISLLAGFFCTLLFETPFMQLEKLLLPTGKAASSAPKPNSSVQRNGIYYNNMEDILKSYKPPNDMNNNDDAKEVGSKESA